MPAPSESARATHVLEGGGQRPRTRPTRVRAAAIGSAAPAAVLRAAFGAAAVVAWLGGACAKSAGTSHGGDDELSLGAGVGGDDFSDACALYQLTANPRPVNLYVMFDKSSSMAGAKWESAKAGLGAFVTDPESAGINVGLRFFPRVPDATPVCDQAAYQKPSVPFGPLPANGPAIQKAIGAEMPDGFSTPMYPALGGALLEGIALIKAKPGTASAVLLVTDGVPEGPAASCGGVNPSDPAEVAKLAANGAAFKPPVLTYVVGLPGVDQSSANLIAKSGGTGQAILVSNVDVAAAFQAALAQVKNALPCDYDLPDQVLAGKVALTLVNIQVTHGGKKTVVPYDLSCATPGWRYDDQSKPTSIRLCPKACSDLKSDPKASIQVVLGCGTLVP